MTNTQICIFNPTTNFVDVTDGAVTGPGVPGAPVILNPNGVVDPTLLQSAATATAGEVLYPGNLVNLYSLGDKLYAQLAYAASGGTSPSGSTYPLQVAGFVSQIASITSPVSVIFSGVFYYIDTHSEFNSSSIGQEVYLSPTDKGGITLTRPSGAGQVVQSVGYVLSYDSMTDAVGVSFLAGFTDFSRISGIAQIGQGGTGGTTAAVAIHNLFGTPAAHTVFAGAASGSPVDGAFRTMVPLDLTTAVFGASGASHSVGAVPDPGASPGTSNFLREDATWSSIPVPSVPFSGIASGTNNAADMVVAPGATLTFSVVVSPPSSGIIDANSLYGVSIGAAAPASGQVLTATSPAAADWQYPPFDVPVFMSGLGTNNQKLLRVKLTRNVTFPAGAANSFATASVGATGSVSPPLSSVTYTFSKNGVPFATVDFGLQSPPISPETGTFTQASDAVFAPGDLFEVDGPVTADATLSDVGITLYGYRTS